MANLVTTHYLETVHQFQPFIKTPSKCHTLLRRLQKSFMIANDTAISANFGGDLIKKKGNKMTKKDLVLFDTF